MKELFLIGLTVVLLTSCTATETSRKIETPKTQIAAIARVTNAVKIAIGRFEKNQHTTGAFFPTEWIA